MCLLITDNRLLYSISFLIAKDVDEDICVPNMW